MFGGLRAIVAAISLLGIGVPIAEGTEPSGHVVWNVAPVEAATSGAPPRIQLILQAVTSLSGVELRVEAPPGVAIAALPDPSGGPSRSPEGDAFLLGDLASGRSVVFDFEVTLPPGTGGIAGFVVTGTLADGRPVRDAVGWTLAAPRGRPAIRSGAAEYPAIVLPEEGP